MTTRRADGMLVGYSSAIARAVSNDDDALLDLVEDFMRTRTGGTLDALSASDFDRLARESLADVTAWHLAGALDGLTLAQYCDTMGLVVPSEMDTVGAVFAIEI